MLNPASGNGEPVPVINFVEEYLDLVESLPLDLQRCVSLMKEVDAKYQAVLDDLSETYEKHGQESDPLQRRRLLHHVQRALIRTEELGDEKLQIAAQMVELVENRTRQFECQVALFQARQSSPESSASVGSGTSAAVARVPVTPLLPLGRSGPERKSEETPGAAEKSGAKRSRRQKSGSENRDNSNYGADHGEDGGLGTPRERKTRTSSTSSSKRRKRGSRGRQEREASPVDLPIDPDEPTYCLCEQVSFGEMICCDNDRCPIEWFHFSCVALNHKPKGKWFCPKCRGDNEKTMDKALERSKQGRVYSR